MSLRDLEHDSIRAFLERHALVFKGRTVVDVGCGRQPYRALVESAGGDYYGFDRADAPGSVVDEHVGGEPMPDEYEAALCTQVIQYVYDPAEFLRAIALVLTPGGALVITGPTNWPIVEKADRWRLTLAGITALLDEAGFEVVEAEYRAHITWDRERFPLGWGAVAVT